MLHTEEAVRAAVRVKDGPEVTEVGGVIQFGVAAFRLGAQRHEQQLILQSDPQPGQTVGNGTKIARTLKQIHAPFHTIGLQSGKLLRLFQDIAFVRLHDGQDDFGAAFTNGTAAEGDTRHSGSPLSV